MKKGFLFAVLISIAFVFGCSESVSKVPSQKDVTNETYQNEKMNIVLNSNRQFKWDGKLYDEEELKRIISDRVKRKEKFRVLIFVESEPLKDFAYSYASELEKLGIRRVFIAVEN